MSTHVSDRRGLGDCPGRCSSGWSGRRMCRFSCDEAFADLFCGAALAGTVLTRASHRIPDLRLRLRMRVDVGVKQRQHALGTGKSPTRKGSSVWLAEGLNRCHEQILSQQSSRHCFGRAHDTVGRWLRLKD